MEKVNIQTSECRPERADVRVRHNGRKVKKVWFAKADDGKFKPFPNGEGLEGHWKKIKGRPKNTLVTIREGNNVYFGISRFDKRYKLPFLKAEGKRIAKGRARKAKKRLPSNFNQYGIIYGSSIVRVNDWYSGKMVEKEVVGLFGIVGVENIKDLLYYFDNIDTLFPQGKLYKPAQQRIEQLAGVTEAEDYSLMPEGSPIRETVLRVNPERLQRLAGVE